jgi:hypothetical protein
MTLATLVAIVVAAALQSRGFQSVSAILAGAGVGVLVVTLALSAIQAARCLIWRKTRGYPFYIGDEVEVTSDPNLGARGRVVAVGQAPWAMSIETADTHEVRDTFA